MKVLLGAISNDLKLNCVLVYFVLNFSDAVNL